MSEPINKNKQEKVSKEKTTQTSKKAINTKASLEAILQRTMLNKVQQVEDKVLAEAIRSMLQNGDEDPQTFH